MCISVSTNLRVLRLYKNLIRYGEQLQLTDKNYFFKRVRTEFRNNKSLEETKDVEFAIKKGQKILDRKNIL